MRTGARAVLTRTLGWHSALAIVVIGLVGGLITIAVLTLVHREAYGSAERVARQVATAVIVPLSHHRLEGPVGAQHAALQHVMQPFLDSGTIYRTKIWTTEGGVARIVFSDEPRVQGAASAQLANPATRPPEGRITVRPVPHDTEHRYENTPSTSLLEAFITFRDATGTPAFLEVYVAVDTDAAPRTALVVLPIVLVGLLIAAVATLPLSIRLARRFERARAEQRAARQFGLRAAQATRHDIARHLHDGVIPNLAGAGMLLHVAREQGREPHGRIPEELLEDAHGLLTDDIRRLRALLHDMVHPEPATADPAELFATLATPRSDGDPGRPRVSVDVTIDGPLTPELTTLLHQIAQELLRNAVRHAHANTVHVRLHAAKGDRVTLTVADDGVGLNPHTTRDTGHVGLLLVRQALAEHGGDLTITSTPGGGTTATATLVPRPAPSTT